jgi:hypothetical protein
MRVEDAIFDGEIVVMTDTGASNVGPATGRSLSRLPAGRFSREMAGW